MQPHQEMIVRSGVSGTQVGFRRASWFVDMINTIGAPQSTGREQWTFYISGQKGISWSKVLAKMAKLITRVVGSFVRDEVAARAD